ncbi:MAG: RDD family protein [Candidatus Brocadiia bacterium]
MSAEAPPGYVSASAKTTYIGGVIAVIVAYVVAQIAVPAALTMNRTLAMQGAPTFTSMGGNLRAAAVWRDRFWYISGPNEFVGPYDSAGARLIGVSLDGEEQVNVAVSTGLGDGYVLAAPDRLWLVSRKLVGFYDGQDLLTGEPEEELGAISPPFLLDGRPAVVEGGRLEKTEDVAPWLEETEQFQVIGDDGNRVLKVLDGQQWRTEAEFSLLGEDGPLTSVRNLRVLHHDGELHLFTEVGATVRHRVGLPEGPLAALREWEEVARMGDQWSAVTLEGAPALFFVDEHATGGTVRGYRPGADGWEQFVSREVPAFERIGVCGTETPDGWLIASQSSPFDLRLTQLEGDQVVERTSAAPGFPGSSAAVGQSLLAYLLPYAFLVLAGLVVSVMMRFWRTSGYEYEDKRAELASLWRRGIGEGVDLLLMAGPAALASWRAWRHFTPALMVEGPGALLPGAKWMLLALAWLFGTFLVFSILEGLTGRTPGKWVTGIKVVRRNLGRCGVGWALLRNLLIIADGFFNYTVGLALVAFTQARQRVGDLAAGTIVIRAGSVSETQPEGEESLQLEWEADERGRTE